MTPHREALYWMVHAFGSHTCAKPNCPKCRAIAQARAALKEE